MKIQKIGVIGEGNMGSGIAQKIAQEGINVVMIDIKDEFVQKGLKNIKKTLSKAVEKKIFTTEQKNIILDYVKGTTNIDEIKDADIIIEAVFEDMDVKKNLFKKLDKICDNKTIFSSNTSSFSITELATTVKRDDRFLGLHFF